MHHSHHDKQKDDQYGDLDGQSLELLPAFQGLKTFIEPREIVATLREGPTDPGIGRRESHGITQREMRGPVVTTAHLQRSQVVQQVRRRGPEPQGALECRQGLRISPGRVQRGAKILPMSGDRRLHQRERIENSYRVLMPPLRKEDLPEHRERVWVMVVW